MRNIYTAFSRNHEKIMVMGTCSADKYAANAFLATKISFRNEMVNIAELVGADIETVRRGIRSGPCVGFKSIYPGSGYGGSCFPKDVRALQALVAECEFNSSLIDAVHERNELQKQELEIVF
jgi:UDPglucose 6-dehydrogenase